MKYAEQASKRAQAKAQRLIGPKGIVARQGSTLYQVGELDGPIGIRVHGSSDKSFRQAFEADGVHDPEQKPKSRI